MNRIVFGDDLISILTLDGDGSFALSHLGDDLLNLDGSHVLFGSMAVINPRIDLL